MQGVKITWAGRAFALAGASDSSRRHKGGRRKTKDERRIMIELFVEKYKASNKGEFPTITVTHKQVGGTFYTVREIWQEIKQKHKSDETRHVVQPLSLPEESYMPVSSANAGVIDNNSSLDHKEARYQEPVSSTEQNIMIGQTQAKEEFNILEMPLGTNAASDVMGVQFLQELTNCQSISSASNGVLNSSHSLELKEAKYQEASSEAEEQKNTIYTEVPETCSNDQTQTNREINTVERELGRSAKSVVNGLPSLQEITKGQSIGVIDSSHSFQHQEGLSDTPKKKNDVHSNLMEICDQNDQTKEQEDIKNVSRTQGTRATSVLVDLQPLQKQQSISISNGGVTNKKQISELKETNYQEKLSDTEDPKVIVYKDFKETGRTNDQTQANEENGIVKTTLGTSAESILMGSQPQQEVTRGACLEKEVHNELENFSLHENQKNEKMHEPTILFQTSETETVTDRNAMESYNSFIENANKPEAAEGKEQELNLSNEMSSSSFIPLQNDEYVGEIQSSNKLDTYSLEKQNSSGSGEELHALHMPSENGSMFVDQKVTTIGAFADNSSHIRTYDGYKKHVMESPMDLSYSANHKEEDALLLNSTKKMIEESTTSYVNGSSSKTDFSTTQEKVTAIVDKDLDGTILSRPDISADQTLSGIKAFYRVLLHRLALSALVIQTLVEAVDSFQKVPNESQKKHSSSNYYLELTSKSETLSLEASRHQQGESESIENTRQSTENFSGENRVITLENNDRTYTNNESLKDSKEPETNIIADFFMKILDAVLYFLKK